jgi:formamidopyrimidine-DNA glycosylase
MPEVSEVALTAEILNKKLKGTIITNITFESGRYTKTKPLNANLFMNEITQSAFKVSKVNSIGKFIWFDLVDDNDEKKHWYIWNTLGLTGMWSMIEPTDARIIIHFDDDIAAYYSDVRNFGTIKFDNDRKNLDKKIKTLTPDFLKTNDFTLLPIKKYKKPIVTILMDQTKIGSGLGNYLTAEILYRAKISPHRLGNTLTTKELASLKHWIKYMVKLAYVDNHIGYMVNLEKEASKIPRTNYHPDIKLKEKNFKFMVYRRKTDPKGNPVKVAKIIGTRSTYWVPAVQK